MNSAECIRVCRGGTTNNEIRRIPRSAPFRAPDDAEAAPFSKLGGMRAAFVDPRADADYAGSRQKGRG